MPGMLLRQCLFLDQLKPMFFNQGFLTPFFSKGGSDIGAFFAYAETTDSRNDDM